MEVFIIQFLHLVMIDSQINNCSIASLVVVIDLREISRQTEPVECETTWMLYSTFGRNDNIHAYIPDFS